ncbi:immunoglobulin-like domain-containing protein [Lysinibacillus sp. NPDC096418]|uniref:immunoglobulin-like domain-containing protein n=1 Tax=Lysinibacillus sp. NPDC096418 TaxID=3364138 RepID=UPI003821278E
MTFSKNNMLHKVFTMTIILFLIFSMMGIQPVRASTPEKLYPVEQLNVQKRSDGSVISVGDDDRYSVSARNVAPTTEDFAAMKFNTIDTTKNIASAKLYLSIVNSGDTVDGASDANLLVRVGSNSWTSSTLPGGFPTIVTGAPSQNKNISKLGTPVQYEIDVKQLLEHPSVVDMQNLTLIMTSNSKNLNIVKHGNTVGSQYNPYLEITYGSAANSSPTNILLSSSSAAENQAANTVIGTLSATDPDVGDTFTYSLVSGSGSTDNASFTINGNQLRTNASFDFETKSNYSVRIRVTDSGGLNFEKTFTINVTNVNEAPTNITLSSASVEENKPANTVVGTLSATDPDVGDTFTYSLVSGVGSTDNGSFNISGNNLRTNSVFDFEAKNSYSVRIRVSDSGGLNFEKTFTINVTNVNEAPTNITLSAASVEENKPANTVVGTLSATDPDAGDTFTYSLVSGSGSTDNASFNINSNKLQTSASFDFEAKNSYSVRIRATDSGGLYFEKVFTITVTDVNEDTIPTLVPMLPVDDATSVPVDTNLTMTFSEAVTAVAGKNIRIYKSDASLVESIAANSSNVTVNGLTLTITPTANFAYSTAYYVQIDAGAFEDSAHQGVQGISNTTTWNFTTVAPSANANLSNLVLSSGTLDQPFAAGTTSYTASVANGVASLNITPTTADSKATIKVNGTTVTSGQSSGPISLNVGPNAIIIEVTAENGTTKKLYTIIVTRAVSAVSLDKVTSVSLNPLGVASWEDVANESSYEMQLYKDGSPLGSAVSKTANTISHDFLGAMRAAGAGIYTVTVTAKGNGTTYLDGPASAASSSQTIIKLATVTDGLTWDGRVAKWIGVASAVSYDVQLYKDSTTAGTATNVLAGNATSGVDFSGAIQTNGAGTYTYKVIAKGNATLVVDGEESGFSNANTVTPVTAPTVTTDGITSLTSTSAVAGGNVTADGGTAITERGFVYATTANPTTSNSKEMVAGTIGLYTANLSGLTPGTTYHYRAYAINAQGTSYGVNQSFTTSAPLTYTVTYDGNGNTGGTVPIDSTNYLAHAPVTVLSNTGNLEKTGYTFGGWNTKVDGTGTLYAPTSSFSMGAGSVTLYAHWVSIIVLPTTDEEAVANAKSALAIGYSVGDSETNVTGNLQLPTAGAEGTFVSWTSSHTSVVSNDGTVVRPGHILGDQTVTLTATITKGLITETKIFTITVKASIQTDAEAVANAKAALAIGYSVGDSETNVTKNLYLPTTGADGTTISWTSSNPAVVTANGGVLRPAVGDSTVVLTTTIVKGNVTDSKKFTIIVKMQDISYPPVTPVSDQTLTSDSSPIPTSTVENIVVNVEASNGKIVSKTLIKRTTNNDGTVKDRVTLTLQSAAEAIAKLREQGTNIARITLPDQQDKVNEIQFSVPRDVVSILKNGEVNLEIVTNNVRIMIPTSSLETFNEDLYFRLVPIKAEAEIFDIEERAKKEVIVQKKNSTVINVLDRPMKIETNMQNRAVEITLPLPTDVTQEQLNHLAIFIEHSDETKEIVSGKVVTFVDGKLGIQFTIQKFSTFAVLYLPEEMAVVKVPVEELPIPQVYTQPPYIQGYADGTFRPNAQITRAQMAAMLARNLSENDVPVSSKVSYSDTAASWAKEEIEYVRTQGIMNGREDETFDPNGSITRAQMAAIAIRWIDKRCAADEPAAYCTADTKKHTFNDVSNQHWAAPCIQKISALGIMAGVNSSTFNPEGYLTRAQTVKVLNRLFEREPKTASIEQFFLDVPIDHWAFNEIQAAATE